MKLLKSISKWFLILPISLIGILIFHKSLEYYNPDFSTGYLSDKEAVFDGIFRVGLYAHIISVLPTLLIGTLLIFFRLEQSNRKLHRSLGKVYVILVLLFASPGGLVLAFYAIGGFWGELAFVSLSLLWFGFTFLAYKSARKGKIQPHKNWMQKSYILCLSAVNLRILLFISHHFLDLHGSEIYMICAWLSWLPFLAVHEIYRFLIRQKFSRNSILWTKDSFKT